MSTGYQIKEQDKLPNENVLIDAIINVANDKIAKFLPDTNYGKIITKSLKAINDKKDE